MSLSWFFLSFSTCLRFPLPVLSRPIQRAWRRDPAHHPLVINAGRPSVLLPARQLYLTTCHSPWRNGLFMLLSTNFLRFDASTRRLSLYITTASNHHHFKKQTTTKKEKTKVIFSHIQPFLYRRPYWNPLCFDCPPLGGNILQPVDK